MVIRQSAIAYPSSYRLSGTPIRTPRRATTIAICASVAVHLAIGAYVLTAVIRPMTLPTTDTPDPPMTWQTVTLAPVQPLQPAKPIMTPPTQTHAPATPTPITVETVALTPQKTVSHDPVALTSVFGGEATGTVEPPRPVPHVITSAAWLSRPSGDQLAKTYPERAARLGVSGSVVLDCRVLPSGSVGTCDVISETPTDQGFAKAALSLGHLFRLKPRTEDGHAVDGGTIRIPVRFAIDQG